MPWHVSDSNRSSWSPDDRPPSMQGGPAVRAIHTAVPGRSRYSVRGLLRCAPLKGHLESSLSEEQAILSISGNILTGNILVFHDPETSPREVAGLIEELVKQFSFSPPGAGGSEVPSTTVAPPRGALLEKMARRKLRKLAGGAAPQQEEPWHLMRTEDISATLGTSATTGIAEENQPGLIRRYGPNLLAESIPRSGIGIFLDQFKSLPVTLLGASAALSFATGAVADALVILAVVGINAAIGYLTESQAEMTIHSLKRLVRPQALVIRSGVPRVVKGEEIVPGDLLVLRPGVYVAADCRIVASQNLSVDESALTGESLPVMKYPQPLQDRDLPLGDRANMAYMGTLVTGGQGLAIVVATGKFTELGAVQAMVGETQAPKTPMEKQLEKLGDQLVLISGAVCGGVFLVGLLRGYGALQMLKTSISLAVAAIPEGLPAVATTTLAIGIRQMRMHKVLIRQLAAVETLGCVETICMDKTGTLTFNRMSVAAISADLRELKVKEGVLRQEPEEGPSPEDVKRLFQICILCNESEMEKDDGGYLFRGSSTENALLEIALASGIDVAGLRKSHPLREMVHRSETRNYMISVHEISGADDFTTFAQGQVSSDPPRLVAIKGSPLEVLAMCAFRLEMEELVPLTDDDRLAVELNNERMAGASLRVLGVACQVSKSATPLENGQGYIWLGLVGMADPVREGVKEVIEAFHSAGIDTLMITGDQVPTAYAIGRNLELANGMPLEILDSTRLREMDPQILASLARKVHVFARVSPAQKLQIVQALQRGGRVVAMTGDGINDSPALKAADIGIAMGTAGTDVAREVADIVLEDDDLQSMVVAVGQGRTIYSNIRKSVHFLLATNLTEIIMMFSGIAFGMGQPLNPMQLLWINLVSDIFPAQALALEPPEPDVLSRRPRSPQEPIISGEDLGKIAREGSLITAGAMGAYLYGMLRHGAGSRASSIGFLTLVSGQLLHALSCRSETVSILDHKTELPPNRYLKWALLGSFLLQGSTVAVPGLRRLLGISPILLGDALVAGGGAILPLLANEALKADSGDKK